MDALLAGAVRGYVIKDIKNGEDPWCPRFAASAPASCFITRAAAALMAELRRSLQKPGPLAALTEQEHIVIDLIGAGLKQYD